MAFKCPICARPYVHKAAMDKHRIRCLFELNLDDMVGDDNIPTYRDLVKMVQDLTQKITKMEKKTQSLSAWVERKKRKLNVVSWLNQHVVPTVGFRQWTQTTWVIPMGYSVNLMEDITSYYAIVLRILEEHMRGKVIPIQAFVQNEGVVYIGETTEAEGEAIWQPMSLDDVGHMLWAIHKKMILLLQNWKSENWEYIKQNDPKRVQMYTNATGKLIESAKDTTLNKIRQDIYQMVKTEFSEQAMLEF